MHTASSVPGQSSSAFRWFTFSVMAGLCVVAFYWFKTASSFREENRHLRESLAALGQAQSAGNDLQEATRELKQARQFDSYKIQQLEAEVSQLRQYSNNVQNILVASLERQSKYAQIERENRILKSKNHSLEEELSGKPRLPRIGGWLGLGFAPATKENNYLKAETGVVIMDVVENSPGENAMLRVKDVVLNIDGEPVPGPAAFKNIMAQKEVGKQVVFDVLRTDGIVKVLVKPREWPQ